MANTEMVRRTRVRVVRASDAGALLRPFVAAEIAVAGAGRDHEEVLIKRRPFREETLRWSGQFTDPVHVRDENARLLLPLDDRAGSVRRCRQATSRGPLPGRVAAGDSDGSCGRQSLTVLPECEALALPRLPPKPSPNDDHTWALALLPVWLRVDGRPDRSTSERAFVLNLSVSLGRLFQMNTITLT